MTPNSLPAARARPARCFPRIRFTVAALALLAAGAAQALTNNFNGGAVSGCSLSGTTYSCAVLPPPNPQGNGNDITAIASGYTVVVSSNVAFSYSQGLQMSGSARLQTSGNNNLDLSSMDPNQLQVAGGTLAAGGNFKFGSSPQAITANVTAATLNTSGASTRITGNVSVTGAVDLGSSTTITGSLSAGSLTTNSSVTIGGALTSGGAVNLGSGNTISGAINAASLKTNSNVNLGSTVTVSGVLDLASGNNVSGAVSAGSIITNSNVTFSGSLTASGSVDLSSGVIVGGAVKGTVVTTNSNVTINGDITASSSFSLGSNGSVVGNITSPTVDLRASNVVVKGNVAASSSITIASGNTVNGNVSGGSLTMDPANGTINGNVTMTGDVNMGSNTTINGDLSARDVTTNPANDLITGNVVVRSIYLANGARVNKSITCTGYSGSGNTCSCVTQVGNPNAPAPVCTAPAVAGPDHIQITHGGSGLTCQPLQVSVIACANSACTAPHYSGNTIVAISPGAQTVTINGGGPTNGTVQQPSPGTATISASIGGVSANTVCINSAAAGSPTPCQVQFSDTGLTVAVASHYAEAPAAVTIQSLKADANGQQCLPLVASATVPVALSCAYATPASSPVPVRVLDANGNYIPLAANAASSCSAAGANVNLTFDASGTATTTLQYAEVGRVTLKASYKAPAITNPALGSADFLAAPKSFLVAATRDGGSLGVNGVLAKAGEPFTVTVSALNSNGTLTTNFGKETPAQGVALTEALLLPDSSQQSRMNSITQGVFGAIANGVTTATTNASLNTKSWIFNEAGTIRLSAALNSGTGYYLNDQTQKLTTSGTLDSRFIPDHFDTTLSGTIPMSCAKVGGMLNPCGQTNAAGSFVYSKQGFGITVTAYTGKDASNTYLVSKNYSGVVARDITLTAWNAAGATGANNQIPPTSASPAGGMFWSAPAASKFTFTDGIGTVVPADNLPGFDFAYSAASSSAAPTDIYVRAIDADGASSQRSGASEALVTVVSGRLQTGNGYGSATSKMPVSVKAQYLNANGAWVSNPAFAYSDATTNTSGLSVSLSSLSFSNCKAKLPVAPSSTTCTAAPPTAISSNIVFKNGSGTVIINPLSGPGSIDLVVNTPLLYLPGSVGRLTFGIYRSGPVVYSREVF